MCKRILTNYQLGNMAWGNMEKGRKGERGKSEKGRMEKGRKGVRDKRGTGKGRRGVTPFGGLRTYNANLTADAAWPAVARRAPHPASLIYFEFPKRGTIPSCNFMVCF